jgi:riboflavin kinase / FMN adenylyltransferase
MNVIRFHGRVITGAGRGKTLGTPTLNIDLSDIPAGTEHGIYAGWAKLDTTWQMAAIHYGPRPVFNDAESFELYLLDTTVDEAPKSIDIVLVERLRDVLNFPSKEDLMTQIANDVTRTRAILGAHGAPDA